MPSLYPVRSQQDATLQAASFALPAAASSNTTSAILDIGSDAFKSGQFDLLVTVPALTTVQVPDGNTVTVSVETSTSSSFATTDAIIFSKVLTGAGGVGIAAQSALAARPPINCARYVRAKVAFGTGTTTAAAVSATFGLRF